MRLANLPEYTVDWQHLACLLYALDELPSENTRNEVTEYIRSQRFLQLSPIDRTPYETQKEERWRTDIAYARKIGVMSGLVSYHGHNAWGITRLGREAIRSLVAHSNEIQLHRCFLWSVDFKRIFQPTHRPSSVDIPRPKEWTRVDMPDPVLFDLADMLLKDGDVHLMLGKLSAKLGFTVASDRASLAFAMQELKRRKNAGIET